MVVALFTIQCAKVDFLGSYCGNGAVDSSGGEDCDGDSYVSLRESITRHNWQCGAEGRSACHFICSKDVPCPSDNWACGAGICVKKTDEFDREPLDVVGPAGRVAAIDLDGDATDDAIVEPIDENAPHIARFSISDSIRSKATTLFPADAVIALTRTNAAQLKGTSPTETVTLIAQLAHGAQVTLASASEGIDHTRELEGLPLVSEEINAAAIDFLYPVAGTNHVALFAWVHGANGNDDALALFDFTERTTKTLFNLPVVDRYGAPLTEHRIVVAIPPDREAPCMRLAVFTRDAEAPASGELQILRPNAACDWSVPHGSYAIAGRYPVTPPGKNAVFVADVDGDGLNDLMVNARHKTESKTDPIYLHGPLNGQFASFTGIASGTGALQNVLLGVGKLAGYKHPVFLGCQRYGVLAENLCATDDGDDLSYKVIFAPNATATSYLTVPLEYVDRDVRSAGFSDLNGDGLDDVWAWHVGATGPQIFEATPTGHRETAFLDYASSNLLGVASISLDGSSARDLIAVTHSSEQVGSASRTSEVRLARGNPDIEKMSASHVVRVPGRASLSAHDAIGKGAPSLVTLASCVSDNCSEASNSRVSSSFNVTTLRPLSTGWLAAPASLPCSPADLIFGEVFEHPNSRPRMGNQVGAVTQSNDASDAQIVTVAAWQNVFDPNNPSIFGGLQPVGIVRWGRLRSTKLITDVSCSFILGLTESIALAPSATEGSDSWIMLGTLSKSKTWTPTATDLKGVAYLLTPSTESRAITIVRTASESDGYRAVYAEHHDVDGDGDNDFVVLERVNGLDGDRTRGRPVLYMNEPCEKDATRRCLFVKKIDAFEVASGESFAWQRSHVDEARASKWPEWWLATIRHDEAEAKDTFVTQRIRIAGTDRNVTFEATSEKHEIDVPKIGATQQRLTWGDFDGDQILDLLYVTDRGSRLYRRQMAR